MKGRSWLWLLVSIMLALLAGVLAIVILSNAAQQKAVATPVPERQVVVASHAIAANSILGADDVAMAKRAESEIQNGAAVDVQPLIGMVALRDISQNEVIRMQYLRKFGLTTGITGTNDLPVILGDDKIAVAMPANDILSNWGAVVPGDHVDVLFTLDVILETPMNPGETTPEQAQAYASLQRDQSLDNVSVLTLQNLEVLEILQEPQVAPGQGGQNEAPSAPPKRALVLKIEPQDAVVLKYLRDSVGTIDLALRSPTNNTLFDVQPVNINYLMLRYGIVLPQPLQ
jgi:Flp pilus assembly protein CpaB